jgi:hypothetical protein
MPIVMARDAVERVVFARLGECIAGHRGACRPVDQCRIGRFDESPLLLRDIAAPIAARELAQAA